MKRNRNQENQPPGAARSIAASAGRCHPNRRWFAFGAVVLAALIAGIIYASDERPTVTAASPLSAAATNCPIADVRRIGIDRAAAVREIDKTPAYTQGLFFADGRLYEGTGWRGRSGIYRVDINGGQRRELIRLDGSLFGEGLAQLGDRFYQLTWRAGVAYAYSYDPADDTLTRVSTFRRDGEGWGLTHVGNELVLSDGSDVLSFVDPATFETARVLRVRFGDTPLRNLNELENVRGNILANVYGDSRIVGIDPRQGCVVSVIDAAGLVADVTNDLEAVTSPVCSSTCSPWDFVLNGIAYDPDRDELYLTGKNWPKIFVFSGILG